jgi:murein DD-endopeptidase MepM/ murein hydrolase activator NlpD
MGDPISSAAPGVVTVALESEFGYGWRIEIDHGGGITTLYAHMSTFAVKTGDRVIQGQRLGSVGSTGFSTGPHLHFEVRLGGVPTDPMRFLP